MLSKAGARQGIYGIGLKSREGACPRAWKSNRWSKKMKAKWPSYTLSVT